jgi:branched-chain amino acid transport system ATP-binding protein
MTHDLLYVAGLRAGYGSAVVLDGVSFALGSGQTLALLGRNGVGKTTLITSLVGHTRRFGGEVRFDGMELRPGAAHRCAERGLAWVPQERAVFRSLTVRENLTATARPGSWGLGRVYRLFPRLREREQNHAHQLSGGEQQMLAIGRALMLNPRLMLLDEPFEGLAPVIVDELSDAIRKLRDEDRMSLVLVEQHATQALELSDLALVLDRGRVRYDGPAADLLADRALLDALVSLRAVEPVTEQRNRHDECQTRLSLSGSPPRRTCDAGRDRACELAEAWCQDRPR